jgi:hypothetical protein
MTNSLSIAPLTRVTLQLEMPPVDPERTNHSDQNAFSFVCGLGIEGLTAFEKELQGMSPGDRMDLHIDPLSVASYLEHLKSLFLAAAKVEPPFELSIRVVSVNPVSERELVRALAEKTEAGGNDCGCDCSCGCGGK